MTAIGFEEDTDLMAMHVGEFEEEMLVGRRGVEQAQPATRRRDIANDTDIFAAFAQQLGRAAHQRRTRRGALVGAGSDAYRRLGLLRFILMSLGHAIPSAKCHGRVVPFLVNRV